MQRVFISFYLIMGHTPYQMHVVRVSGSPQDHPDSKVHGANMGPIWVLSAPDGPHVGPMNLAIRAFVAGSCYKNTFSIYYQRFPEATRYDALRASAVTTALVPYLKVKSGQRIWSLGTWSSKGYQRLDYMARCVPASGQMTCRISLL